MAYVSKENKAEKLAAIKPILKKHGVKATLAVDHYSSLVLNISSSKIDFFEKFSQERRQDGHAQVNVYHYDNGSYNEPATKFLQEAIQVFNMGNFDRSDSQSDYFHVGWYVNVNIGKWNKPYTLEK